jgi:hypothetical protein
MELVGESASRSENLRLTRMKSCKIYLEIYVADLFHGLGYLKQDMQAAMGRALEITLDNPEFLQSMDGEGFPWVTVQPTTHRGFSFCKYQL